MWCPFAKHLFHVWSAWSDYYASHTVTNWLGLMPNRTHQIIRSFRFFLIWSVTYKDMRKRYQEVTGVYQPCTCLCLGFSQIILMRPFLLMTLHFSHIGFTELLTFISKPSFQKRPFSNIPQGLPRGKHFFISIKSGKNELLISVCCDDQPGQLICLSRWYVPW